MSDTPPDSKKGADLSARPEFDKRELYDKEVKPLVDSLHAALLKHEIPSLVLIELARSTKKNGERTELTRDRLDLGSTGPKSYVPAEFVVARMLCRENGVFKRIKLLLEISGVL